MLYHAHGEDLDQSVYPCSANSVVFIIQFNYLS